MKQFSFCLKDISEFDAWAQSFRETCPQEARTVFGRIARVGSAPDRDVAGSRHRRMYRGWRDYVRPFVGTDGDLEFHVF